jgi:hypothetical protein
MSFNTATDEEHRKYISLKIRFAKALKSGQFVQKFANVMQKAYVEVYGLLKKYYDLPMLK